MYASTQNSDIKRWLENLRCVIVDTDNAIRSGYFKYLDDYSKLLEGVVDDK